MTQTKVRAALISVSDKTGLIPFATGLCRAGAELISTGGTARALREAGLTARDVSDATGFPEMMDGRVKTLHPAIHGGLLAARGNPDHEAAMKEHGIPPIDLLAVNLYPFEETAGRGASHAECIENIDIGGPAMIRAAAKNHAAVTVVTDAQDYPAVLAEIESGGVTQKTRERLAGIAWARVAAYDAAVAGWMAARIAEAGGEAQPRRRAFAGRLTAELRYGENPHQGAAFYADGSGRPGVATAEQVQGKALSYNNIADADAAFECVAEFRDRPAAVIVKHGNPCGAAEGATLAEAHRRAFDCDGASAFGGVVALNRALDGATAEAITRVFTEVAIAPGADRAAREVFARRPNLRLLLTGETPDPEAAHPHWKQVAGGFLVQDRDAGRVCADDLTVATKRKPSERETADCLFAWRVAKHVKSNAVVFAKDGATVGVGAGQTSRVDAARIAARKSAETTEELGLAEPAAKGAVAASDAFFPFADGLLVAAEAGVTAVIQPGGSVRDEEVIAAADEAGLAMLFTGMRHFRH